MNEVVKTVKKLAGAARKKALPANRSPTNTSKMNGKFFMWYDSSRFESYYGPFRVSDKDAISSKLYHSLDEILKADFSDTLKKRLTSAKIGAYIKVHRLHSNGSLMVRCVDAAATKKLDKIDAIFKREKALKEQLSNLVAERAYLLKGI